MRPLSVPLPLGVICLPFPAEVTRISSLAKRVWENPGSPALKISPHPTPIEATPLTVGEGPGVRGITCQFHLPVVSHRGMITQNDMAIRVFSYATYPCQPQQGE